ncbi:septal ring lytic transglycosylase RlpA family protein [Novosphingobium album (ex Liu et al. 2023)]|uniref:Endolytic peptidoglycan transglycosylase RlpA n=1 Tax=Novosphingobium album (ex Liu et al. 2023) TaxID=3031130 RepID=A0ABT5WJT9_9SPHN|nr:septal ring lytic transglycosylase RlpA family protein [Novosphingobium album (ex Liu et al. 2023)]MDE8650312.1 septal ring lytic transglycosylase RlpA family protein [Novosphingobium album (ex Liu et al. 2023)]
MGIRPQERRRGFGPMLTLAATLPLAGMLIAAASPALADEGLESTSHGTFDRAFSGLATPARTTPSPADLLDMATNRPVAGIAALRGVAGDDQPASAPVDARPIDAGIASYYGAQFTGRRTASGDVFDPGELTAAHRSLPFGSLVRVTNTSTGASVVVRINDRGPYHGNRVIDLSRAAASEIGLIGPGSGRVELTLVSAG